MDFRNSSRNRKAVKIERDSRSHTKFIVKIYPQYLQDEKKMQKKSEKKTTKKFPNPNPKQSGLSEIAVPTLNLRLKYRLH